MREWCRAGYRPLDFWHVTPREYKCAIDGALERIEYEADFAKRMTWHGAYLSRTKDFPRLEDHFPSRKDAVVNDPNDGLAAMAAQQRALNREANQ